MVDINSNYEIKYEKNQIAKHITDILTLELSKNFFSVHFVTDGEEVTGCYKITGYKQLDTYREIAVGDLLSVFIAMLYNISDGEKHLLFSEDYQISQATVFTDKGFSNAKMVYIPEKAEVSRPSGKEKLLRFLDSMSVKISPEGNRYLQELMKYMRENNFSYTTLIHRAETMRQEVYLCGIE
ncbi:MAG TPA: hypothetical protein VJY37_01460 [Anaerovoracaceae bacterium]|nr:hypothetical protein [Anaerovoracaceae bacterium]